MKTERQIAELIFDKFRNVNCKVNQIVPIRSLRFSLIDKLNPKEKELFDNVFIGLQALDYFTYETDVLESIRLTQKGYDYIYDDEKVEQMLQKPWIIPQQDTSDWNSVFNKVWKIINEDGSPYYLSQTPFYKLVQEINSSLPPFTNYLAEREKKGKSRTREYMYYDLINELPIQERFEFYVKLQDYIEKTNQKEEKTNDVLDFSPWDTEVKSESASTDEPTKTKDSSIKLEAAEEEKTPIVFISYSWDSPEHEKWVLDLATVLRKEYGVDVILDKWDLGKFGKLLPNFMEQSIAKSDRVICIMTPTYKKKSDKLEGGTGYETSIITAEIFTNGINTSKFIPLLRSGNKENAIPTALGGRNYVDMRTDENFESKLEELLRDIYDKPKYPKPQKGPKPNFD